MTNEKKKLTSIKELNKMSYEQFTETYYKEMQWINNGWKFVLNTLTIKCPECKSKETTYYKENNIVYCNECGVPMRADGKAITLEAPYITLWVCDERPIIVEDGRITCDGAKCCAEFWKKYPVLKRTAMFLTLIARNIHALKLLK